MLYVSTGSSLWNFPRFLSLVKATYRGCLRAWGIWQIFRGIFSATKEVFISFFDGQYSPSHPTRSRRDLAISHIVCENIWYWPKWRLMKPWKPNLAISDIVTTVKFITVSIHQKPKPLVLPLMPDTSSPFSIHRYVPYALIWVYVFNLLRYARVCDWSGEAGWGRGRHRGKKSQNEGTGDKNYPFLAVIPSAVWNQSPHSLPPLSFSLMSIGSGDANACALENPISCVYWKVWMTEDHQFLFLLFSTPQT